jgi:hypothetical protein
MKDTAYQSKEKLEGELTSLDIISGGSLGSPLFTTCQHNKDPSSPEGGIFEADHCLTMQLLWHYTSVSLCKYIWVFVPHGFQTWRQCHVDYSCKNCKWIKGVIESWWRVPGRRGFLAGQQGHECFQATWITTYTAKGMPNFGSHFQCQFPWYKVVGTGVYPL